MSEVAVSLHDNVVRFKDLSGRTWILPLSRIAALSEYNGYWSVVPSFSPNEWITVSEDTAVWLAALLTGEHLTEEAPITGSMAGGEE